ncbi:MAG: Eco57I restriction-modification methylase domain-containing protein [Bacteroidales bacterium]|nr:Eco57I restriction-modification methylase domain-containing protein [Bacteroidales bacterium]
MTKKQRKEYGQFFTGKETAAYMASLFDFSDVKKEIRVLDAGAGSGILSVSLLEHLFQQKTEIKVHLTCYETDINVLPLLNSNLELAKQKYSTKFDFSVITDNYLLSQQDSFENNLFSDKDFPHYDLIIGNPPYKKIGKDAPEAKAMQSVCYGAPNLYFLFAAMGISNLNENGQMVYIIPRSWTSGAYFKNFRNYLVDNVAIKHIHLFESRDTVFDKENVLQETMIIKVEKQKEQQDKILITTSQNCKDFDKEHPLYLPYNLVVSKIDKFIYLPTNEKEIQSLHKIVAFKDTLISNGLKMKTGLVVNFRATDLLENDNTENSVPLFYSTHIEDGMVKFPIGKKMNISEIQKRVCFSRTKTICLSNVLHQKKKKGVCNVEYIFIVTYLIIHTLAPITKLILLMV